MRWRMLAPSHCLLLAFFLLAACGEESSYDDSNVDIDALEINADEVFDFSTDGLDATLNELDDPDGEAAAKDRNAAGVELEQIGE